jgi:hypothetical protein
MAARETPLDQLPFPVACEYCGDGPFNEAYEVDEHITDIHFTEAVRIFAAEHMKKAGNQ